jgi:hypothetical protein
MKTLGIILLAIGVIVMGITAFDFVQKRKIGSEEQVEKEQLPFPWKPTAGAVLIAGGIILIGANNKKRVM